MIVSYRDAKTERFAKGERVKEFSGFARQAEKTARPAGSRYEPAGPGGHAGKRAGAPARRPQGQYSIRINDQWRICFEWPKGANGPVNVEITDYH